MVLGGAAPDYGVDPDVVGRIGKAHVRHCTGKQPLQIGALSRIPADQPVLAQGPQIAWARYRRPCQATGIEIVRRLSRRILEVDVQSIDLGDLEAGDRYVQSDFSQDFRKAGEFVGQFLSIPTRALSNAIVGEL